MTGLAQKLAAPWGLDAQSVKLLAERENRIFIATYQRGHCVIRLHRAGYRNTDQIRSELQMMQAAQMAGCRVPEAIPTLSGDLLAGVDDAYATAIGWVDGKTRSIDDLGQRSEAEIAAYFRSLGAELANLHNVYDHWQTPDEFSRDAWDAAGLVSAEPLWGAFWENSDLTQSERKQLEHLRHALQADLASIGPSLDFGLIHADAVADNVIQNGDDITLIDFDDAGFGYRLFDLATVLIKWVDHPQYAFVMRELFAGYRTKRDLNDDHMLMMLTLRAVTYVGWIMSRRDLPNTAERSRRFITTALKLSKIYLDTSKRESVDVR